MIKCSCLACEEARGCRKCITAMAFAGNFRGACWIHIGSKMQLSASSYGDNAEKVTACIIPNLRVAWFGFVK